MTTLDIAWLPQWTTSVKIESGGRYPLGTNRFHNGLEEFLIKSITWLANSLPYFTFGCWAIGDIALTERPQDYAGFVKAFQRRESALAIGRYLWRRSDYIPGSTRVSALVNRDPVEYDTEFSIMESTPLGAFGLYYAGSAYNLGLVENDENGVMVLSPSGHQLYDILDRRYRQADSTYYHRYRGKSRVPKAVLIEWGEINDVEAIRRPEGRNERDFYKNLLFRLDQPDAGDYRRHTLAFFLECINRCAETDTEFSEAVLSNINYYSAYYDQSGRIREFEVPASYRDAHFYWGIYDGHVYFRDWLSRYFQVFLNHLKGQPYGSTVDEFFDALDTETFDAWLSDFLGRQERWLDGHMGAILDAIGRPAGLADSFSEHAIYMAVASQAPAPATVAMFTLMMANLWRHFMPLRADSRYRYLMSSRASDLWFDVLFSFTKLPAMSVRAFLRQMLKAYVIEQHDRIMIEKHDLRRCWFTVEKGRYFFVSDESLMGRPAKYGTIMAYLQDMNLIHNSGGRFQLTAEGKELFNRLKREFLR